MFQHDYNYTNIYSKFFVIDFLDVKSDPIYDVDFENYCTIVSNHAPSTSSTITPKSRLITTKSRLIRRIDLRDYWTKENLTKEVTKNLILQILPHVSVVNKDEFKNKRFELSDNEFFIFSDMVRYIIVDKNFNLEIATQVFPKLSTKDIFKLPINSNLIYCFLEPEFFGVLALCSERGYTGIINLDACCAIKME